MAKISERLPRTVRPRLDIPFIYKSYSALTRELGAIDGLASAIILATRALRAASGDSIVERRSFVEAEAVRYGVNTRWVDFDRLEPNSSQLLLVGVVQQSEAFVDGLRAERTAMGRPWPSKEDGVSKMHYLMSSLGEGFSSNLKRVGEERYHLFDYYRRLRNAFVHGAAERAELEKLYDKVRDFRSLVADEYGLSAPNHYDALGYDDYMLATRVMKYLATDFCRLSEPQSAEELIELMQSWSGAERDPMKIIMGKRDTPERMVRTLRGWFDAEYSFEIGKAPQLEAGVVEWLNKIPNRSGRWRSGLRRVSQFLADRREQPA